MSRAAPGGREAVPLRAHALRLLLLGVVLLGLHVGAARGDDDAQRGMRFTSAMQSAMIQLEYGAADALASVYMGRNPDGNNSRWTTVARKHRDMVRWVNNGTARVTPRTVTDGGDGAADRAAVVKQVNSAVKYLTGSEFIATGGGVKFTIVANIPWGSPKARKELHDLAAAVMPYKAQGVRVAAFSEAEDSNALAFKDKMELSSKGVTFVSYKGQEKLFADTYGDQAVRFLEVWFVRPNGRCIFRGHTGLFGDTASGRDFPLEGNAIESALAKLKDNPNFDGADEAVAELEKFELEGGSCAEQAEGYLDFLGLELADNGGVVKAQSDSSLPPGDGDNGGCGAGAADEGPADEGPVDPEYLYHEFADADAGDGGCGASADDDNEADDDNDDGPVDPEYLYHEFADADAGGGGCGASADDEVVEPEYLWHQFADDEGDDEGEGEGARGGCGM